LNPLKHYTVVTEKDIEEAEEKVEPTMEEKLEHCTKVEERRKKYIIENWTPKHEWLYSGDFENIVSEEYKKKLNVFIASGDKSVFGMFEEINNTGIYLTEKMFSEKFLNDMLEEVDGLLMSGLPLMRPNSMNRYGLILSDIGLYQVYLDLYNSYFKPIFSILYPDYGPSIDDNHSFIVNYKKNGRAKKFRHTCRSITHNN